MSTITAISTPAAVGGISVIRVSGDEALKVAARVFRPAGGVPVSEMKGYTCAYGRVVSLDGETLDDGVLTVFRAPKSYTGEDVAEISCHGGIFVTRRILREIISAGAEPASAGEFTKRAFLNGKLSLTQAEAVADIISSEGEAALKSANLMREGALFKDVSAVSDKLVGILGSLAAWTDYPDEDIPETSPGEILSVLEDCRARLQKIIENHDSGIVFREGIPCAIVGRPNVGTPSAGTTRDVVEERLRLGDVILRISDTAGIRDAEDTVERLGVDLAKRAIERSTLCFAVFDGSEPLTDEDETVLAETSGRRRIIVINKADLPQKINKEYFSDEYILEVSAKERLGLEKIRAVVYDLFGLARFDAAPAVFANERQKLCCDRALSAVGAAISAVRASETLDAVTVCIDAAAGALLELSGQKVTEAVVDDVFSRFCVGK